MKLIERMDATELPDGILRREFKSLERIIMTFQKFLVCLPQCHLANPVVRRMPESFQCNKSIMTNA
jgi:hypothetical protein